MFLFILGMVLAGVAGGVTWNFTENLPLCCLVGAAVAAATWAIRKIANFNPFD